MGTINPRIAVAKKAVRLPGTEHMDKAYHQKAYYRLDSVSGQFCHLLLCHTIKKTDDNYG